MFLDLINKRKSRRIHDERCEGEKHGVLKEMHYWDSTTAMELGHSKSTQIHTEQCIVGCMV